MGRLGDALGKQGRFLIENDRIALLCIAVLALVPFTAWVSSAIVALITLRKGWIEGLKGFSLAFIAYMAMSMTSVPLVLAFITAALAFMPCYIAAVVLHETASVKLTGFVLVLQTIIVLSLIHWITPEFIMKQYQYLQMVFKELEQGGAESKLATLLNKQDAHSQLVMANYFVGIQSLSLLLSAVASLALARSVQSRIYYPGGFRQELLGFRAMYLGVVLLLISLLGAYKGNTLAISCLPVLVVYYLLAGLSLSYCILAKNKGIGLLILLLIPLLFMPFFMVPAYAAIGVLDSLFNFRVHLLTKADGKENKG